MKDEGLGCVMWTGKIVNAKGKEGGLAVDYVRSEFESQLMVR